MPQGRAWNEKNLHFPTESDGTSEISYCVTVDEIGHLLGSGVTDAPHFSWNQQRQKLTDEKMLQFPVRVTCVFSK